MPKGKNVTAGKKGFQTAGGNDSTTPDELTAESGAQTPSDPDIHIVVQFFEGPCQ
jgi:hypothetical protein